MSTAAHAGASPDVAATAASAPVPDPEQNFRFFGTLPNEIDAETTSIGTSTLFSAWYNAIYVTHLEEERLAQAMTEGRYLDVTKQVLKKYNGLRFNDESYAISRKAKC